jgi:hypothetical protein
LRFILPLLGAFVAALVSLGNVALSQQVAHRVWVEEWPRTDFEKSAIAFSEIRSGGQSKDGIPAIDEPRFETLSGGRAKEWAKQLSPNEAVVALTLNGDARAYPLRILIWHEIVNDEVGGVPVAVTYCPLCNSALAFERTLEDRVLDFGTTGKLRHSDLVMYDRQTESWWQQFTGEAIVGALTGSELKLVPSTLRSFAQFAAEHPDGRVLIPTNPEARPYGRNPYVEYDAPGKRPFLYAGELPPGIDPMERVVAVETRKDRYEAWLLTLVREQKEIRHGDLVIRWQSGQASALDVEEVAGGRDVGTVTVLRETEGGGPEPVVFDTPFAFAFYAFYPESPIHSELR